MRTEGLDLDKTKVVNSLVILGSRSALAKEAAMKESA